MRCYLNDDIFLNKIDVILYTSIVQTNQNNFEPSVDYYLMGCKAV
jgi:hypothetical protein